MGGGHYTAYISKSPGLIEEPDGTVRLDDPGLRASWHYFSDSHTSPVELEAVLSKQAYVLFYEQMV